MKSTQQITTPLFRCLLFLSGIVLCSLLPFEIHSDGNNLAHLPGLEIEYLSENEGNEQEEKDANHFNYIFELVFKESVEKKESSSDTNSLAVIKQGIHLIKVACVNFSSDHSLSYKGLKFFSKEYSLGFVNRTPPHFLSYLLSLTGDIAINAP